MQTINARVYGTLVFMGSQWQTLARDYAPSHTKPYINVTVERAGPETVIMRLTVNLKSNPIQKFGSADARAQEYGSGEQARRGSKLPYDIWAKNKPNLVFMGTHDFEGQLIRIPHVVSPGIPAANDGAGYVAPATKEFKKVILSTLGPAVRESVVTNIRQIFSTMKGTK